MVESELAVAQAQKQMKELQDRLQEQGLTKFGNNPIV